jgi:hypothetical protein
MLLQILGPLEWFAAELALIWLQRHMNPDVRSHLVTRDPYYTAVVPLAFQIKIVCTFPADMLLADVALGRVGDE